MFKWPPITLINCTLENGTVCQLEDSFMKEFWEAICKRAKIR